MKKSYRLWHPDADKFDFDFSVFSSLAEVLFVEKRGRKRR